METVFSKNMKVPEKSRMVVIRMGFLKAKDDDGGLTNSTHHHSYVAILHSSIGGGLLPSYVRWYFSETV